MRMNKKNKMKAIIAFVVALVFVLPGSAVFANFETTVTVSRNVSSSEVDNTIDFNNIGLQMLEADTVMVDTLSDARSSSLDARESVALGTDGSGSSNNVIDIQTSDETIKGTKTSGDRTVDWWPMFGHDLNHSGYSTGAAPDTNNLLWTYTVEGGSMRIKSSPAVVDGKLYFGSAEDCFYCLNASDGSTIWTYRCVGGGVRSSAAVVNGRVFFGSSWGGGSVHCLNASDGSEIWRKHIGKSMHSSPAVVDGKVFIGSRNGKLYCLNELDGLVIWTYTTGDQVRSSPAVAEGKVYVGSFDGKLYCLNTSTGILIWSYDAGSEIRGSPTVANGKVFFGSGSDPLDTGYIYCLNAQNGSFIWRFTTAGAWASTSTPAVVDEVVIAGINLQSGGTLFCLNQSDGSVIWERWSPGWPESAIAIADGKVYYNVYDLLCRNLSDGSLIWKYALYDTTDNLYDIDICSKIGPGSKPPPAVADGKVFVASSSNKVYCFGQMDHDVGVTGIDSPVSGKAGIVTPEVTVENFGLNDETDVPVNMKIIRKGDLYLYENFSGDVFPPDGWTEEEPDEWGRLFGGGSGDPGYAGGGMPEAFLSRCYDGYTYLQSVPTNTRGATSMALEFKNYIRPYSGRFYFNCNVLIRANSSQSWTDITPWPNPILELIGMAGDPVANTHIIDVSSFIGTGTEVRFEYDKGSCIDHSPKWWNLDDISLYETFLEYNETVNTDIDVGENKNVVFPEWTPDNLYGTPGSVEYVVTSCTQLVSEEFPDNDCKTEKMMTLDYIHDVGVEKITEPSGRLCGDEWIHFDDGVNNNAIGLTNGGTFQGAIRITPDELGEYYGWSLTSVRFYHYVASGTSPTHSGYIMIYEAGTSTMPGAMITAEPYTVTDEGWFEIPLSNPVLLDIDEDVWVSVQVSHAPSEYPLGTDVGPAVDGKGDWIELGGTWDELQYVGFDCNWNIWAKVEESNIWPPGTYPVEGVIKNNGAFNESDFNVGATIWLTNLSEGDEMFYQDNVTVTTLMTPGDEFTVVFDDVTFEDADEGEYRLEVTTELDGDEDPDNDQKTRSFVIVIPDTTPPVTTHDFDGVVGDNNWYVSDVTITLDAEDDKSGVRFTYYKLADGDEWQEYEDPVVVSADGRYDLSYYSVDYDGNNETVNGPFDFKIDQTAPTINLAAEKTGLTKWLLIATVSDETSGIAKVEFYVDNEFVGEVTEAPYELVYTGKGETAMAIAYDNAGNSKVSAEVKSSSQSQSQSSSSVYQVIRQTTKLWRV